VAYSNGRFVINIPADSLPGDPHQLRALRSMHLQVLDYLTWLMITGATRSSGSEGQRALLHVL